MQLNPDLFYTTADGSRTPICSWRQRHKMKSFARCFSCESLKLI